MHILDRLKAYLFAKNGSCIFEPGATINFQSCEPLVNSETKGVQPGFSKLGPDHCHSQVCSFYNNRSIRGIYLFGKQRHRARYCMIPRLSIINRVVVNTLDAWWRGFTCDNTFVYQVLPLPPVCVIISLACGLLSVLFTVAVVFMFPKGKLPTFTAPSALEYLHFIIILFYLHITYDIFY